MIKIKHDTQYLSYVLENNAKFFPTAYRVLKKQQEKGFIPCSKISFNGHIKLLYPVNEYISAVNAAEEWNLKDLYEWMLRLLKTLTEVQDSGFLRIDDVDLDLSHIFIDNEEKRVRVVVLPLAVDAGIAFNAHWEQVLEKALLSMIEVSPVGRRPEAAGLKKVIQNKVTSLDSLYKELKKAAAERKISTDTGKLMPEDIGKQEKPKETGELHLITRNSLNKVDIAVTKDSFILGKNPNLSDWVLTMSPHISRQHCKITTGQDGYYIEDINSLNHTYVNGEMLKQGEKVMIENGNQIRLAEVEFIAEFRK